MNENNMDGIIKELTLLLIYLTSWEEDEGFGKYRRSWKGYLFEVLNELNEEGYITGSKRSKSVYLTKEGIEKAERLVNKYIRSKN